VNWFLLRLASHAVVIQWTNISCIVFVNGAEVPFSVYFLPVALNSLCMCLYELLHIYLVLWKGFMQMNRLESEEFRWAVALPILIPLLLYLYSV